MTTATLSISAASSLFQRVPTSRANSMLTYQATFYPIRSLKTVHALAWSKQIVVNKTELLALCNEEQTYLNYQGRVYPINWANNCIPTEVEWNKLRDNSLFCLDFKASRFIQGGQVVTIVPVSLLF